MPWLTIPEAAKRVGRSQRTIYSWIGEGHITKYDRLGRDHRVVAVVRSRPLLEVDAYMRSRRGRPKKTPDGIEYFI
jgi:excisionase family DNA binding protein